MPPIEPADPADAMEPEDPTERMEPADPIDNMDPTDPIDRIEPTDPIDKIDPTDAVERTLRIESTDLIELIDMGAVLRSLPPAASLPDRPGVLVESVDDVDRGDQHPRSAGVRQIGSLGDMSDQILDVDLLAFETGSSEQRRAVVDGVTRSLARSGTPRWGAPR